MKRTLLMSMLVLSSALVLSSCGSGSSTVPAEVKPSSQTHLDYGELTPTLSSTASGQPGALGQGDTLWPCSRIDFPPPQTSGPINCRNYTISYDISSAFTSQQALDIRASTDKWNLLNTRVKLAYQACCGANFSFIPLQPGYGGFGGYSNHIGKNAGGGSQTVQLSSAYTSNTAGLFHEVGHVIGLVHEDQRCDRDTWVTPDTDQTNYPTSPKVCNTVINQSPYDYYSMMHYNTYIGNVINRPIYKVAPGKTLPSKPSGYTPFAGYTYYNGNLLDNLFGQGFNDERTVTPSDLQTINTLYPLQIDYYTPPSNCGGAFQPPCSQ